MYSPVSLKIKNMISFEGEHEYQFRKGEAIVVTGVNYDNPSQKVNGTGKSALIESIAVAITGTSIRDVKAKELINRRSKDGEVEFTLTNPKLNHTLTIWRKIYAGSKSAECRIWINEDEVRLSDINSYNKFIFDQIGLTKEDFFNFYLLVQANYQPFLRVGDTKKKEIINRFSGADNVDQLIPLVKQDLDLFDPEFERINREITRTEAKIEVNNLTIGTLTVKLNNLDSEKKRMREEIEKKKTSNQNGIESYNKDIEVAETQIKDLDVERKTLNESIDVKEVEAEINTIQEEIDQNEDAIKQLKTKSSQVKIELKPAIDAIVEDEKTNKEQLKEVVESIKEYEEYESEIKKQILDSIECPSCHHKFSVRNKEFDVAEAQEQIPQIEADIEALKREKDSIEKYINETLAAKKQDVNQQILTKQEEYTAQIKTILEQNTENNSKLSNKRTQITVFNSKLKQINTKIKSLHESIQSYKSSKETLVNANKELDQKLLEIDEYTPQKEINEVQQKINELEKELAAHKTEFDALTEDRQAVAEWETNFKNFKSYIANQSIKNIEDYTNLFLQQMGSDLGIHLDGYTTLASKKIKEQISTNVLRGGFDEGSYGAFSGGERGRIDICVIIAIQQLINLNCPSGGLDLLICDEILDQIDALGLESIINSLQNLDRTIMIVSQNEINTLKEHTLLIEKRNKISKFVS